MQKETLLKELDKVATIANVSKLQRMMMQPVKYAHAILFRELVYKKKKREKEIECNTFFGTKMKVLLPSSTDIYLTGGKSHDSEIRLAKLMINYIQEGSTFMDIGAHYGYFSLLALKLVGDKGKVISFEAAPNTYKILSKNKISQRQNFLTVNAAVSDSNTELIFYEFPNLYSEYNTLDASQFKGEQWTQQYQPQEVKVRAVRLDDFLKQQNFDPQFVKIDVEGAEYKVLSGAKEYLSRQKPIIVMEYLCENRKNETHKKAARFLYDLGYESHIIKEKGNLQLIQNIDQYFSEHTIDSDNIVFSVR